MKSIKKILTLMLAVMLIATSMAMPVMADDEAVVLINDTKAYSTELSEGVYVASWNGIGNEFGDPTQSSFVSNNAGKTWLVFDAGTRNTFTYAEFKLGVHVQGNWYITDMGAGNSNRIYYSNNGKDWTGTYASCEVVQESGPKIAILKAENIPNARYVRIGSDGMWPTGHGIYYHSVSLKGAKAQPKVIIDSPYSYSTEFSTGVYKASWGGLGAEAGDTSSNTFMTNSAAKTWLAFDAGFGNVFTDAEFKVGIHSNGQGNWWITNYAPGSTSQVFYSNDGVTWTGAYASVEVLSSTAPMVAKIVASNIPDARYVKIGTDAMWPTGHGMFYHSVKLSGFEMAMDELVNSTLDGDPVYSTELSTGIYKANWNGLGKEAGDSSRNTFITNDSSTTWLAFDAGEGNIFKKAEFKVGIHYNGQGNWFVTNRGEGDSNTIYYSNDGVTWTGTYASIEIVQQYVNNSQALVAVFKADAIPNARYVRIGGTGMWPQAHGLFYHYAKLLGYEDALSFDGKPTLSTSATEYAVNGKLINLGNAIEDALVLVAVYDGDELVSANFAPIDIANGENAINIAADVTGKTIASPKAKLFVWDATNYTPYLSVVEY